MEMAEHKYECDELAGANPIYKVLCRLGDGCFFPLFSSFFLFRTGSFSSAGNCS
jgi:hypothetical protein